MRRSASLLLAGICALTLASCAERDASNEHAASSQTVVLYTSADDVFVREVIGSFERDTGITVRLVGDTEATKTTGLVTRLLAERDSPRCDVWWSSEPMGTLLLDESGVLEPGGMGGLVPDAWPEELIGHDQSWVGFAERGRVIAYASDRVDTPPTTLAALTDPEWSGRVGMARPQFGTTRGQMALLYARWGAGVFEAWLQALNDNGVRLYDGNARVVRAIYEGEIDVGLTDTDDVWVAIANGWPIAMAFETPDDPSEPTPRFRSFGATTIPNTVAIVADGPNPEPARRLAAYLISPTIERLLAQSDSRNIPVDPSLRGEFARLLPDQTGTGSGERPDYSDAALSVEEAMDLCERVLISP